MVRDESGRYASAWRKTGRFAKTKPAYEGFMPLPHLDARPDPVQCIRLSEELAGRGSALTRPPRLALADAEREVVEHLMRQALATWPTLPDVGL